ncbi:hypothetical protein ACEPAH_8351 [Sanghuangporus vaninii]
MMVNYPSEAEARVIFAAEMLMKEAMAKYDPSHDAHHVQRVRRTALAIANSCVPKPDLLVIELAALLHDVLDKKYVSPQAAIDPCAFFKPFFESVESHVDLLSDGRATLLVKIIENVSWSTEKKLCAQGEITDWHKTCLELHCVHDADRLDAIGAFGIMRCAGYSCTINRPLHAATEDPTSGETAVAHFHDKLLKIIDSLKTDLGKKLGHERHNFMLSFLDALNKEYAIVAQ